MDGAFLSLDSEAIEAEVDEYYRELYKIQKIFNNKVKKLQAEKEERDREKKKKKRHQETDGDGQKDEEADDEVHIPAALTVCNTVHGQIHDFKVRLSQRHLVGVLYTNFKHTIRTV